MCLFIFLTGSVWGWYINGKINIKNAWSEIRPIRDRDQQYHLINPLLAYDTPSSADFWNLREKIEQQIRNSQPDTISVYFRDLKTSRWLDINGNETYSPASLLKVPVLIAYLKLAETEPKILEKKIIYNGAEDLNQAEKIKPKQQLQASKQYTVSELISYMMLYSDNNALSLLTSAVDKQFLKEVFDDLGIVYPDNNQADLMTAKDYSLFFRILYNSTYLNRDLSESALDLLARTDYRAALVAGMPENIQVSHKFGEREISNENGVLVASELHDCGIVYYPDRPYLLCIMTKGSSLESLQNSIKEISRIVYGQVRSNN